MKEKYTNFMEETAYKYNVNACTPYPRLVASEFWQS